MKQKDIALIIVIAFVTGVASFVISGKIFVTSKNRQQKVEVVDVIKSEFQTPSSKYFSTNSINPTQLVQVGGNNNTNPFNTASQ